MGLDMYLDKEYYVKNWNHQSLEEQHRIAIVKGDKKSVIPVDKISYVRTNEITWRKSNQIHKWFVDNVQDGEDDCGRYSVSVEQLKELLKTVEKVLDNRALAEQLLPVEEGFFFGGNEYGDWYWDDLEFTGKELVRVLDETKREGNESGEFYYHASW